MTASLAPLGDWMRVARASVRLRPVNSHPVADRPLARNLEVRVMAARRGDYRVWLSDGTVGLLRPQDLAVIPTRREGQAGSPRAARSPAARLSDPRARRARRG